ncbi:MAG: hypothetical protein CSA66_08310, partial [Proteobacteria bacterium]
FVDDEVDVLAGLRRSLRRQRKTWQMRFESDPLRALEVVDDGGADVIVSDLRMPRFDGVELLRRIRERHPEVIRVVLSGYAEASQEREAYHLAHRFLPKPCPPEQLVSTLRQAVELRGLLTSPQLRNLVGGVDELPAVPEIYAQLSTALHDHDTEAADVARLISTDAALVAAVLRAANSAMFARLQPVSRVRDAVVHLGRRLVTMMVLGMSAHRSFERLGVPRAEVRRVQARALTTADLAARIVARGGREHAYAAGMLHDIGQLVLSVTLGERYVHLRRRARDEGLRLVDVETAELGAHHATVGGYLLGLWGLPGAVVAAVSAHHDDRRPADEPPATRAVYLAQRVVGALRGGEHVDGETLTAWGFGRAERLQAEDWLAHQGQSTRRW